MIAIIPFVQLIYCVFVIVPISCNEESEGFPVVLPLVGTGLSRTKKDQQDVLKYLINAFRINKAEINCDIHIVVRNDIKNEIAIMNIK